MREAFRIPKAWNLRNNPPFLSFRACRNSREQSFTLRQAISPGEQGNFCHLPFALFFQGKGRPQKPALNAVKGPPLQMPFTPAG